MIITPAPPRPPVPPVVPAPPPPPVPSIILHEKPLYLNRFPDLYAIAPLSLTASFAVSVGITKELANFPFNQLKPYAYTSLYRDWETVIIKKVFVS